MLKTLTEEEKSQEPIEHALKMRQALNLGNYARFFKLYRVAPNKSKALIDVFVDKIRTMCLQKLSMGYVATNIELDYLRIVLAFETTEELRKFLADRACVFIDDGVSQKLDCKASLVPLRRAPLKLRRAIK